MANVSILPDNPKIDKYADVTMAVGRGAPNRRDDVLLVQYMLDQLFRRADEHVPPLAKPERLPPRLLFKRHPLTPVRRSR